MKTTWKGPDGSLNQLAAELASDVQGFPIRSMTVTELAEMSFHADERVRMLEMMNTPIDYEARKKAFIELAEARASAVQCRADLQRAIGD